MKVMWIVNTIFPYVCEKMQMKKSPFGGWLNGLFEELNKNKDITLAITSFYHGKELKEFYDGKTYYYLVPYKNSNKYDKNSLVYFKMINEKFNPDIVHIHGTENPYGLCFMDACPNVKTVVSIQGLLTSYKELYDGCIKNKDIIKNITIRDIIKHDSIRNVQKLWDKKTRYEQEILKRCNHIIGRTNWDYAATYGIVLKDKYKHCNESLREEFYKDNWNIKNTEKHSIFISQSSYPIKGFHFALKALNILKKDYNNVKLYVAGFSIIKEGSIKERIKMTGYGNYLKKLINKYNLQDNVIFTGVLNVNEMKERLLKSSVFVQSSVIENSPNSLGEAMLLGMPIVASNVGGTSDMLVDKEEGLLYQFTEYTLLAKYIKDIFEEDELAIKLGKKAQKHALITHDRNENSQTMMNIYKEVLHENNK